MSPNCFFVCQLVEVTYNGAGICNKKTIDFDCRLVGVHAVLLKDVLVHILSHIVWVL